MMNSKRTFSRRVKIFADIIMIFFSFIILIIGLTFGIESNSIEFAIAATMGGITFIILGIFDLLKLSRINILKQSKKRNTKQIIFYDEILKDDPNNIKVIIEKGATLIELEKYQDAIKCFNQALEIEPHNLEATARKRFTLEKLKNYENAEK